MEARTVNIRSPLGPTFIYGYRKRDLLRTNLLTGDQSSFKIPNVDFNRGIRMSELPGGKLILTGAVKNSTAVTEVVKIDTLRECAVSSQPPMHTARIEHAAVYYSQYLYVLGGYNGLTLRDCERYVCAESRWEVLPALPVACHAMSAVVLETSLYVLGGYFDKLLSTVQKFSLDSLTWELMHLRLPQAVRWVPCFKTDSQVHLVLRNTLYSFTPLQVKTLPQDIYCISSYYSGGTLYYSWNGDIRSLELGELA
jgi:hypothetical protein